MGAPQLIPDSKSFSLDRRDLGKADTLRYNVLVYVAEENYDRAIHELKSFFEKDSEFPRFKEKIERYISYSIDLVNAIRAKRRFPGMNSLTSAKQQEIVDKFHMHFKELKQILKKIEKVYYDLEIEDRRSTIIVVKAVVNASLAIAILAFVLESSRGMMANVYNVSNDVITNITDFIFQKFGM
jgi:hypothetical protein